ncbi:hypothetical protein [Priestia megaterium]|uniref:hypothetical protein n=1 Tax=Priestia megaterium TaxID=1404 RepID=UPI001596C3E9|nr:hypothetical protein [Priestia megaterium]
MDKTLVKLAKSYTKDLMTQIYLMELIKESEVIPNDLEVAELGGKNNATISD